MYKQPLSDKSKVQLTSSSKDKTRTGSYHEDNRMQSVMQRKMVERVFETTTGSPIIQRKISITEPAEQLEWHEAYFKCIYPIRQEIIQETGATEMQINNLLKKYAAEDIAFPSVAKLIEILKQELAIGKMEPQTRAPSAMNHPEVEDSDDGSGESSDEKEFEDGGFQRVVEHILSTKNVFGLKIGQYNPAIDPVLYRSVEKAELFGIIESMIKTGKPSFAHKSSIKGRAEKFFAPNKAYVVTSMGDKGKRSFLMEIVLDPKVMEFIYNPENTGLDKNTEGTPGFENLEVEKSHAPKSIIIKTETPKSKKGRPSYISHNIGFRKDGGLLERFSGFIIGINLVNHEVDLRAVKKQL